MHDFSKAIDKVNKFLKIDKKYILIETGSYSQWNKQITFTVYLLLKFISIHVFIFIQQQCNINNSNLYTQDEQNLSLLSSDLNTLTEILQQVWWNQMLHLSQQTLFVQFYYKFHMWSEMNKNDFKLIFK